MFKILIVDDQAEVREALKAILEQGGHILAEAQNGRVAQNLIQANEFDLVISDLQMPDVNGLELLSWIKANKKLPVILLTGFTELLETQKAYKLGADDFFTKPFSIKDILSSINRLMAPPLELHTPRETSEQYCRIPIEDFVSSSSVQINVYIKLSEEKFVRVAHKGDLVPKERVENYKSRGLTYLYARKEDFARLVGFNLVLSHAVRDDDKISQEKKLRFLRYTTELVLENAVVNGVNTRAFKQAVDCLELVLSLITENQNIFETLAIMNTHADWLYAHSLGVSLYSVMIARRMGWSAQATLFKLSVGGLFHDIGQKEISLEVLQKSRSHLSFEERKLIESHTTRSKEILLDLKALSDDVIQIVYEHHEDCTGRGYPRNISQEKIHPLAKIVAVADRFCYLAMKGPISKGESAREVLRKIQIFHGHELDKTAFNALAALCSEGEATA